MTQQQDKTKKTPSALKKFLLNIDNALAITFFFSKAITLVGYLILLLTFLPTPVSGIRTGSTKRNEKKNPGGPTQHLIFGESKPLIKDSKYFMKFEGTKEYATQFNFNEIIDNKGTSNIATLDQEGNINNKKMVATYRPTDKIRPTSVGTINGSFTNLYRNAKNQLFIEERDYKNNLIKSTMVKNAVFEGMTLLQTKKLSDDSTIVVVQGVGDPLSPRDPIDKGYMINSITGEIVKALPRGGEICPSKSDSTFFLVRWDGLHKTLIGKKYDKNGGLLTRIKFEMDYSINSNQFAITRLLDNTIGIYAITTAIKDQLSLIYRNFDTKGNALDDVKYLNFDLPRGKIFKLKGEPLRNDEYILTIDYEAKNRKTKRIFLLVKEGKLGEKYETSFEENKLTETNAKPYSSIFPSPYGNKGFVGGIEGDCLTSRVYAKNDLVVKNTTIKKKTYLPETEYNLIENFKKLPWDIRDITLQVTPTFPNMTVQHGLFKIKSDYVINQTFTISGQMRGESNIARFLFNLKMLPEPFKFGENTYEIGLGDIFIPINVTDTHRNYPPTFSAQNLPKGITLPPNGTLSINGQVIGEYQLCDAPLSFNVTGEDGHNPPKTGEVTLKIRCSLSPWTSISIVLSVTGVTAGLIGCIIASCVAGYSLGKWEEKKMRKKGEQQPLIERERNAVELEEPLETTETYTTLEDITKLGRDFSEQYDIALQCKNKEDYNLRVKDKKQVNSILKTCIQRVVYNADLNKKENREKLATEVHKVIHTFISLKKTNTVPDILTKKELSETVQKFVTQKQKPSNEQIQLLEKTKSFKMVACSEVLTDNELWNSLIKKLQKELRVHIKMKLSQVENEQYTIKENIANTFTKESHHIFNSIRDDNKNNKSINYEAFIQIVKERMYKCINDLAAKNKASTDFLSKNTIESIIASSVGLWVQDQATKQKLHNFKDSEEIINLGSGEGEEKENENSSNNDINLNP